MGLLQTIRRGAKKLKDQVLPDFVGNTATASNPNRTAPQAQARPQVNPYSRTQYNQAVGGLSVAPVRNPALDIKPIPTAPTPDLTVTTAKTPDFSIGNTPIKPSLNSRTAPAPQQGTNIVKEFAKQIGNTGQFAASNVALAGANIAQGVARNAVRVAGQTPVGRVVAPVVAPISSPQDFIDNVSVPVERAVTKSPVGRGLQGVGLGALRVGAGYAQAAGGAYDLATPGLGKNRLSKSATALGKQTDDTLKEVGGNQAIYKGAQLGSELLLLKGAGSLGKVGIKGLSQIPKVASGASAVSKGVKVATSPVTKAINPATAKVSQGITKVGTKGLGGKITAKAATNIVSPKYQGVNAAFSGIQLSKEAAQGRAITPERIATDLAIGGVAFPVAGAVGSQALLPGAKIALKGVGKGAKVSAKATQDAIQAVRATQTPLNEVGGIGKDVRGVGDNYYHPTKLENAGPTTYSQFSATAQPSPARLTPLGESGGIQLPFAPKQNLSYSSTNGSTSVSGKAGAVRRKIAELNNNETGAVGRNVNDPLDSLRQEASKYKSADEFDKFLFTRKQAGDPVVTKELENLTKEAQKLIDSGVDSRRATNQVLRNYQDRITLSPEKYKNVDEFIKSQGKPLYHGTNAKFDRFSLNDFGRSDQGFLGKGVYLTGRKGNAKIYGNNIVDSYANLKNPLEYNDSYTFGSFDPNKIRAKLGLPNEATAVDITNALKAKGYDGVVVHNVSNKSKGKMEEVLVLDPNQIKTKQQLTDLYNQAQPTKNKLGLKKLNEGGTLGSNNQPTIRNAFGEDVPNPNYIAPVDNPLGMNMDSYKTKAQNPSPEAPPAFNDPGRTAAASLTDEQASAQIVRDLGVSKAKADELISQYGRSETVARLYGSKDKLRSLGSQADAYATGTMKKPAERGQRSARQGMPSTTTSVGKPPLRQVGQETPKGTPDPEIPGLIRYDTPNPSLDRVNDLYGTSLQRQIESSPVARLMMEAGDPVRRAELARLLEEGRARELPPEEAIVKQPLQTNTRSGVVDQTPLPKSKPIDLDNPSTFDKRLTKAIDDATNAMKAIDDEISASGINPDDLRAKMTAANRKEYQLTPDELIAADKMSARLNQARGILEESGVKFDGEQMFYTPQVKKGTLRLPETRDDLFNFGYSKSRGDKLGLEEIDYTKNPLVDYIVKAENRGLLIQKSIDDAAKIDGRIVPEENVVQAASKVEELQQKVQNKSKSKAVLTNDTVSDLQEIGRLEGYVKQLVNYKPGRIVQSPKAMLEKAGIYKRGFEQFENAAGYGSQFKELVESQGLRGEQLYRTLEREIRTAFPDVEQSSVNSAISQARRTMERDLLAPGDAAFVYQNAFRNVAKSELFRLGKTTEFANSKMQKVVNEQINYRLMQDAYKNGFLGSFDNFVTERINVSLRGLNIVSALFETGDYANIWSKYGIKDVVESKGGINSLEYSAKYGQDAPHFQSPDLNEISKWDKIWADPNTNVGKKIWESYRTAENKILFFRYIELHKTEMFFRAAEDFYKSEKGGKLSGVQLTNAVMEDYYSTMLPHKVLTANRILGKSPKAVTQYVNWSLQATKRLGRTVAGADEGGKFGNMDRSARIARGVSTEIVPKVAVAAMLGVPIQQVLGMRDFTGATTGDFTGVSAEDKNLLDNVVEFMSISPTMSVAASYYFADRRNDIADQRKLAGETYRADRRPEDAPMAVTRKNLQMLVPFKTQANKTEDVIDAKRQGYYANRDGRVQTEAPKGGEFALSLVTGKSYSPTFRDYQDNPDFRSVYKDVKNAEGGVAEKGKKAKESLTGLITKNQSVSNLVQTLGNEPTNRYKRPLTDEYSDAYKKADKNAEADLRKDLLAGGRNFNQKLDDLKRFDRPRYDKYIASMDGDNVSPEFWKKIIEGDAKNNSDLKVVHIMRDRKLQQEKDMNASGNNKDGKYDVPPMYKLGDTELRQVLKEKSTPTGEDLALKNILYKEQWYKDYKDAETAFFKNRPKESEEFKSTARVKEWEGFNDQYLALTGIKGDTLKKDYPLVWQLKQYEYGSDQGKQFLKNNYDAWKAQSDAIDGKKLAVINEMRRIEKQKPMTVDQYAQATAIEKTAVEKAKEQADKDAKYASYGSRGAKGGREDKLSASEIFNPYSKIKVGALNKKVSSSNIKRVALKSKVKKPSIRKTA